MKIERYIEMKSPITGGRVKLVEDIEEYDFRKEKYSVHVRYCICEDTGEQFTMKGQDDFVLNQIYGQYRVNHGIPFPDEIRSLRERYGLNYTQINKIMGFGTNQWKLYEQGAVPSESNGKIIVTIRNEQSMLSLLEASKNEFTISEYEKVKASIISAPKFTTKMEIENLFYGRIERGIFNGFAEKNPDKLQAMVRLLILKEGGRVCPTKLNKAMFYSDFLHFRHYGKSISGLSYRAIQYGPVPEHYDTIYDNVEGITKESIIAYDNESVFLSCTSAIQCELLCKEEIDTVDIVSRVINPMKTADVVELSHGENAWKKYVPNHGIIPYSEAFDLIAVV